MNVRVVRRALFSQIRRDFHAGAGEKDADANVAASQANIYDWYAADEEDAVNFADASALDVNGKLRDRSRVGFENVRRDVVDVFVVKDVSSSQRKQGASADAANDAVSSVVEANVTE